MCCILNTKYPKYLLLPAHCECFGILLLSILSNSGKWRVKVYSGKEQVEITGPSIVNGSVIMLA